MWHEQRREERRIKGMLVDRRKRAERRRDYWERIKSDPVQFLQVHGRSVKIHLDPAIAAAGDNPVNMMPWPGDEKIMIDRFDARANLDFIPEYNSKTDKQELSHEESKELRISNYERYKILIQNEFLNVTEDKFLHTIELEEKYGSSTYQGKKAKEDKKLTGSNKVAIGFKYEDSAEPSKQDPDEDDDSDLDSDEDFDLNLDVTSLDANQVSEMNKLGHHYGLEKKDVFRYFTKDFEDQEQIKANKAKEAEKSGDKKSRRKRNRIRIIEGDPLKPAYAMKRDASGSKSRSESSTSSDSESGDGGEEKIEFITTFGGDSDQEKLLDSSAEKSDKKIGPKLPKHKKKKRRKSRSRSRKSSRRRSRSRSPDDWVRRRHSRRSRSRSGSRPGRRSSRSISLERSRIERRLRRTEDSPPPSSRTRPVSPPRKAYSPPPRSKEKILSNSDSDSSDSDEGDNNGSRYRSKYRNRKADSSDDSEEDAGKESPEKPSQKEDRGTDSLYHNSLSRFFKGIQDNKEDKKEEEPMPVLNPMLTAPEPPPVKRYYGRNRGKDSDSELSLDSDGSEEEQTKKIVGHKNGKNGSKGPTAMKEESVSIKDKLKKKMLQQIKKTFKEDKKAEKERLRKLEEEEQLREEELRDLSEKMRMRERERRRAEGGDSGDSGSRSRSSSPRRRSRSRSSDRRRERRRSRSRRRRRSRSRSRSRSKEKSRRKHDRRSKSRSRSRSTYISRKGERKRKSRSGSREAKKSRNGSTEEKRKLVDY